MRLACRHSSPQAIRCCWTVFLFTSSSLCRSQTEQATKHTYMRSHTYTHPAARTQRTSPRYTRFSFSPFFLWPTLSVLSFFLSHYLSAPPFPFSISSFFLYTCIRLLLAAPTFPLLSLPPSLHSPPSHTASPSISSPLSLQCVQSERPLSEPQRARTMEWRRVQ